MNKFIAAAAAALAMTIIVSSYSDGVQADLRDNIVRLHIIADSDSGADQSVKLKVRDAVLEEMREMPDISVEKVTENLDKIEETANRVLRENGFDYAARAMYGKFPFPEKTYKSMTLPAGDYYGVRIVLGSGKGHNWWCVMYPPLCMSEDGDMTLSEEGAKMLRETLNADTYDIITQKNNEVTVKFKIVEMAQEIKQKITSKQGH